MALTTAHQTPEQTHSQRTVVTAKVYSVNGQLIKEVKNIPGWWVNSNGWPVFHITEGGKVMIEKVIRKPFDSISKSGGYVVYG